MLIAHLLLCVWTSGFTISPTAAPSPPSCGSWTTSAYGASCDAACTAIGQLCDPVCQSKTNTITQVNAALAAAGGFQAAGKTTCSSWGDDGTSSTYGPVDPGLEGNGCYYASGATSSCPASNSNYYRICACKSAVTASPTKQPMPPPTKLPTLAPTGENLKYVKLL